MGLFTLKMLALDHRSLANTMSGWKSKLQSNC